MSQDRRGTGAAAGGEHLKDAADPASTDVGVGDIAKGFFKSVKDIKKMIIVNS